MKCSIMLHFIWVFTVSKVLIKGFPENKALKAYTDMSRGNRGLNFGLSFHLHSYFVLLDSMIRT